MRYTALQSLEENIRQTGSNGEYSLRKISVPVPGENLKLEGLLCTPNGRSGYYHAVTHPKKRIVLHFTAGQTRSDLSTLTIQDRHVSVPFVIARDGTIYQLFSSKYWSGHLGKGLGNIGTGNAQDKCTIGIELSNYGYLTERDGNLETYYSRQILPNGNTGPVDIYCSLNDQAVYQRLSTPFRNQSYYATYTLAQYESLIVLLRYLTAQYNIPRNFLPESQRFQTINDVLQFNGIVSHINYRSSGKWDIGPAFNWRQVIEGVQASQFVPTITRSVELERSLEDEKLITSEQEIDPLLPKAKDPSLENEPYEDSDNLFQEISEDPNQVDNSSLNSEKPKLYALLVGINEYENDIALNIGNRRVFFPPLRGCVPDAEKMQEYLQKDTSFDPEIKILKNNVATKAEVVKQFREHLNKAKEGDVALFYYSGHGAPEDADTAVWTSDTDGRLECIACYYDDQTKNDFLLADKELRYLIHEVSRNKPHIVTIFDCCHSADNTRNGEFAITAFKDKEVVEKGVKFSFPQRDWDKFIFSKKPDGQDNITPRKVIDEGEANALPEGYHVQLAACEDDESALEVAGEGVFTKTLLKVLEASGGDVTYYALQSRVRQYLRNLYEQKPRIYVKNGNTDLLYASFLNKGIQGSKTAYAEVTYNDNSGWQLGLGAIHGIGAKTKSIKVMDPLDITKSFDATVGLVGTDYTQLIINTPLNEKRVYKGYVEGLLSQNLQVYVQNVDALPEDQEQLMDILFKEAKDYIVAEDEEENAQYVVRASDGRYYITHPQEPYQPRVAPVSISDTGIPAPLKIAKFLKHISQWEYLKNFTNQDAGSTLASEALKIELFQVASTGKSDPLNLQNGEAILEYEQINGKWKTGLRVKLTNMTGKNFYCSTLYLTSSFGSFLGFLNPEVYKLEAGNSVELQFNNSNILNVSLNEVARLYNWKEQIEHLKFIFSTELFDARALSLETLPKPDRLSKKASRDLTKDIGIDEDVNKEEVAGWATTLITLRQQNPEVNTIRESELTAMVQDPDLANFALGNYFDASVGENFQPVFNLKPHITLKNEDGSLRDKGILQDFGLDVANWWARRRRNERYNDIIKRFPERIRIVSEGDSWFQHPLVLDIIDHLSRTYAVYCVAAAGDTLRNYFSDKKGNGEFYMNAIADNNPEFFLISGGGNDILGSQFRSYLIDNPDNSQPVGTNPKHFLKDSLFSELDSLMEIYYTLFNHLKTHKPDLHIIVHGYDYPVKLNDANKGWLGRYMIEKGIDGPGDRKAIIQFIMDTFNERLENIAKAFDNVSYLNVRNIVRFDPSTNSDQWYDEIHPDDDGFQQVAMKFMQRIDEVIQNNKV